MNNNDNNNDNDDTRVRPRRAGIIGRRAQKRSVVGFAAAAFARTGKKIIVIRHRAGFFSAVDHDGLGCKASENEAGDRSNRMYDTSQSPGPES